MWIGLEFNQESRSIQTDETSMTDETDETQNNSD